MDHTAQRLLCRQSHLFQQHAQYGTEQYKSNCSAVQYETLQYSAAQVATLQYIAAQRGTTLVVVAVVPGQARPYAAGGLLQQHVLPTLQALAQPLHVQAAGQRDVHGRDARIVQHLACAGWGRGCRMWGGCWGWHVWCVMCMGGEGGEAEVADREDLIMCD